MPPRAAAVKVAAAELSLSVDDDGNWMGNNMGSIDSDLTNLITGMKKRKREEFVECLKKTNTVDAAKEFLEKEKEARDRYNKSNKSKKRDDSQGNWAIEKSGFLEEIIELKKQNTHLMSGYTQPFEALVPDPNKTSAIDRTLLLANYNKAIADTNSARLQVMAAQASALLRLKGIADSKSFNKLS